MQSNGCRCTEKKPASRGLFLFYTGVKITAEIDHKKGPRKAGQNLEVSHCLRIGKNIDPIHVVIISASGTKKPTDGRLSTDAPHPLGLPLLPRSVRPRRARTTPRGRFDAFYHPDPARQQPSRQQPTTLRMLANRRTHLARRHAVRQPVQKATQYYFHIHFGSLDTTWSTSRTRVFRVKFGACDGGDC